MTQFKAWLMTVALAAVVLLSLGAGAVVSQALLS